MGERRRRDRSRRGRQAGQADPDGDIFRLNSPRGTDGVLHVPEDLRLALARHRECPGSPPDWRQISACMIFGSTVRAQAVMSVVRFMVFTSRVEDAEGEVTLSD
jgi:hypothetical protein